MKRFDPRSREETGVYYQAGRVFSMDANGDTFVVATSAREIWVWDVRNMEAPVERRESPLKFQNRVVKCMPNGKGLGLSCLIAFRICCCKYRRKDWN